MDFLLHHILRTSTCRFPDKEAVVHGDQRLTYAEVSRLSGGLAYGLQRAGLQRGDRVGIFLKPSIPQVLSIFSVLEAGGVFVPINDTLFPNQVAHIVKDCGVKALITDQAMLSGLADVEADMPSLEFAVVLENEESATNHLPTHCFGELCELTPQPRPDAAIGKDPAAILYTSGSTGSPKGIILSHANIIAGAAIVSDYVEMTDADRILAVLPFSFDAGLNQLTSAFLRGGTLILMTFVFAREIVQMLLKERISGLAGVPTVWSLLVQHNATLRLGQSHF